MTTRPVPVVDAAYVSAMQAIAWSERRKRRPTVDEVYARLPPEVPLSRWAVRLMLPKLHALHGV